jgi:hypothetical protein
MTAFASRPTRNPFPAEAVATYGKPQTSCVSLGYMSQLGKELNEYLRVHPTDTRYGGAVGLKGAHGSGKTHILTWLGDTARQSKKIRSTVFYGKCDSSSFFDLYRQFTTEQFGRDTLVDIIQLALLNLARAKVREAKVTEGLEERLKTAGALQVLQAENNIDLENLRQQLLQEFQASGTPIEMARVILDVPDPNVGVNAHRWITGNDIPASGLEPLGVSYQLSSVSQAEKLVPSLPSQAATLRGFALSGERPDPEVAAIAALSAVATLHRVAGVPLIVLVDQLEVLLRVPDGAAFQTLSSLLKKFVEELSSRMALVFIAGIAEPWKRLPRDVPARFRGRAEIVVGSLTHAESELLLRGYTEEVNLPAFESEVVEHICELAGGNPREILRIAYQLYEAADGNLQDVTGRDRVLQAARQSGTVADRAVQALAALDSVLQEFGGRIVRELRLSNDVLIDRALMRDGEPAALFEIAQATDAVEEVDSARRIQATRDEIRRQWPQASLTIIAVGYSSAEVRDLLLRGTVALVKYDEKDFEATLRARLVSLPQPKTPAPTSAAGPAPSPSSDSKLLVDEMNARFRELEAARRAEQQRIEERFTQSAAELAKPATEEQRLQTRREVLDALDTLQEKFQSGDLLAEQRLMRSILIGNEAYLKNRALDDFGESYLEAIGIERNSKGEEDTLRAERRRLMVEMQRALRRPTLASRLASRQKQMALVVVALLVVAVLATMAATSESRLMPLPREVLQVVPPFLYLCAFILVCVMVQAWFMELRRGAILRQELDKLRDRVQSASQQKESLKRSYPQASP